MSSVQTIALPRAAAHPLRRTLLFSTRRSFTSSYNRRVAEDNNSNKSPFGGGPAPPRLPKEEQEIFERLQRQSTGAFSTPKVNQSPDSQAADRDSSSKEEPLYPHLRQAAQPEFEGEKNPKTGEIGGPKNEPLRWGHQGDWSYNGRVTDF
ncbi:hypothetical protein UA08_02955 [Talaromyces atroroseus]|uniref:Succinate dehydrogenase assembly factor 4, mitochondrial n=1 Tax=Talaromyces atroroseus TaxID=1441469 RepID=A0A225B804_TALAT|nr:hypothetical protein UA08_02955 [Talaromyces atroroseus]OKL62067.1 hypothetical protein UA08_02955 [Talaromyces atroroseus]